VLKADIISTIQQDLNARLLQTLTMAVDMPAHQGTSSIHGSYVRYDGSAAYKYYGKYTSDFPAHWEVKIWRSTDMPNDVLIGARAELSGDLLNGIQVDTDILQALVIAEVERGIEDAKDI
jgi:hypothetical protein